MSNFSFSYSVFKRLMQSHVLTLSKTKSWFLCVCSTSLLKTLWEKEKLLVTSSFPQWMFFTLSTVCIKFEIFVCKLRVWKSQNVSFGKGLTTYQKIGEMSSCIVRCRIWDAELQIFFKIGGQGWPMEQNMVSHFLKWRTQSYRTKHNIN